MIDQTNKGGFSNSLDAFKHRRFMYMWDLSDSAQHEPLESADYAHCENGHEFDIEQAIKLLNETPHQTVLELRMLYAQAFSERFVDLLTVAEKRILCRFALIGIEHAMMSRNERRDAASELALASN